MAIVSWPPNLRDMLASPTYRLLGLYVYSTVPGLGAEDQKLGSLPTEPFSDPLCGLHAPGNFPNRALRVSESSKRKQHFQECSHQLKSFRDQNWSPGQVESVWEGGLRAWHWESRRDAQPLPCVFNFKSRDKKVTLPVGRLSKLYNYWSIKCKPFGSEERQLYITYI